MNKRQARKLTKRQVKFIENYAKQFKELIFRPTPMDKFVCESVLALNVDYNQFHLPENKGGRP